MSSLNKVCLIGNLGRDPEVRRTASGDAVVTLSVATSESWTDKRTGEKREKTEWHRVVIFNEHLTKIAEQYLHKGSKLYLEGKMQTREWEKDGVKRYSTEVVLNAFDAKLILLTPASGSDAAQSSAGGQRHDRLGAELNDEIPF